MANAMHEMTKVGYDNLVKELENCTGPMRLEIAARLKEAISYGDISENSEYDAAKEAQAENEDRIKEIEEILRTAKVVDADDLESEGTVQTGVTVRVKDLVYDEEMTYQRIPGRRAPDWHKTGRRCGILRTGGNRKIRDFGSFIGSLYAQHIAERKRKRKRHE